jgi:hypothetical protein
MLRPADRRVPRWACRAEAPRASLTSACSVCWTAWASGPTSLQSTELYQRAALETQLEGRLGVVRVLPRVRLGWGDDLPLQAGFPLGGDDGFPGLHLGERRGDREAMLGLMSSFPLKGPLLARVELAAGPDRQPWVALRFRWMGGWCPRRFRR